MTRRFKHTLLFASVLGAGLNVSVANAQWTGLYGDLGVGFNAATAKTTDTVPPPISETLTDDVGKSSFVGSLGAGWRWDGGVWVLGVGAFYDFPKITIEEARVTGPGFTSVFPRLEQKNRYGIGVDLGWKPTPPIDIYAKVTANWAKVDGTVSTTGVPTVTWSNTHSGLGYGLGIRYLLPGSPSWYLFAEWQQVEFNSKSQSLSPTFTDTITVKPKNTIGLIGVGVKFP